MKLSTFIYLICVIYGLSLHFNFWAAFKAESIEFVDPAMGINGLSYLANTNLILLSVMLTPFDLSQLMKPEICFSVGFPATFMKGNKKNAVFPAASTLWMKSTSLLFPKSWGLNSIATPYNFGWWRTASVFDLHSLLGQYALVSITTPDPPHFDEYKSIYWAFSWVAGVPPV